MNQKALLNGMEYTILDLLPSLDYSDRMVLCQNASGQKYNLGKSCAATQIQCSGHNA